MDDDGRKQPWWIVGRTLTIAIVLTVFFCGAFALSLARALRTDLPDTSPLLTWGGASLSVIGIGLGIASVVYHLRRDRAGRDRTGRE